MSLKAFAWKWFMSHSVADTSYACKPCTNGLGRNSLIIGKDNIYFEHIHNLTKWRKVISLMKTRYGQLKNAGIDQYWTIQLQFICSHTGLATWLPNLLCQKNRVVILSAHSSLSQFPLLDTSRMWSSNIMQSIIH